MMAAQRGGRNAGESPQRCLCPLRCALHQPRAFVCIEAGAVHVARRTIILNAQMRVSRRVVRDGHRLAVAFAFARRACRGSGVHT